MTTKPRIPMGDKDLPARETTSAFVAEPRPPSRTPVSAKPPGGTPLPPAGPARVPAEPEGFHSLEAELARAARRSWPALPGEDVAAAVEGGFLAAAQAAAAELRDDRDSGHATAMTTAKAIAAAAALQRHGLPLAATQPVDWYGFGTVIPVVAASPGAGASIAATLLTDVLQLAGRLTLLIDPADPPRSGLASATRSGGITRVAVGGCAGIRFSWRAQALLARLDAQTAVIAPGAVPPPRFWRPPVPRLDVTVVDLGHDPWRVAAQPLFGVGAWLRRGTPQPRPVLVVRPSRPSLLHAEQVLARLESWAACAAAVMPAQLVVMGAKRWPPGVAGAAGRRVAELLPGAVFVPHDAQLSASGVTDAVTPARLRQAITPVLQRARLVPEPVRRRGRTKAASS